MKIGKAKIGGQSTKKYFKLEKGDNVYRILPPLGDLADSGTWAVYYKVHYGYRGLPGSDGKARMKPFVSPEKVNFKNKMVEVVDAAKVRIEKMKAAIVSAKEGGDMDTVKQLSTMLRTYNLDAKWYVNAINLEGEIGLLKIPHKAKQALETEMKRLSQEGVDALGVENGRYFVFQRSGEGRETQYQVRVYKQKIEVQGLGMVEKDMPHTLTPDILSRLDSEAHELEKLFARPTAQQVEFMVNGGAAAVEEVLGKSSDSDVDGSEDDGDVDTLLSGSSGTQGKSYGLTEPAAPSNAVTESSMVSGVKVEKATTSATSQLKTEEATPVMSESNQTPEEFLKSIGLG